MASKQLRSAVATAAARDVDSDPGTAHSTPHERALLSAIMESSPDGIVAFDSADQILTWNKAAERLFGYSSDEAIGKPLTTVFPPKEKTDRFQRALAEVRRLGQVEQFETIQTARDGTFVDVSVILSPIRDSSGVIQGVLSVHRDIRERRQLELHQAKTEGELRNAQKLESVGRLTSGIAHEINTPIQFVNDSVHFVQDGVKSVIGVIRGYQAACKAAVSGSNILETAAQIGGAEEEADLVFLLEEMPDALTRALDGLDRVAVIVRSMKEFAHPDQKEKTSIDLNRSIATTLTVARNEYKYVADLTTEFGEIPFVTCFPGEINQVVLNLVVNASHAIADVVARTKKKGHILVRTWRDQDHVMVTIEDTGGGIPESIRDRIFDPFFTTKGIGKGTGQGLAIARSVIAEKHSGSLTFETNTGFGTTFRIRLPINGKPKESAQ